MQRKSIHTMSIVSWDNAPLEYLFKNSQAMVKDWHSVFTDTGMLSKVANRRPCNLPSEKGKRGLQTSTLTNNHAYRRADSEKL